MRFIIPSPHIVVLGCLLASFPLEAKLFGYAEIKAGYSRESFLESVFHAAADTKTALLRASNTSDVPLGASAGVGYYFTPNFGFRVEAEYIYRLGAKFKKDALRTSNPNLPVSEITMQFHTQIQSLLGNVYLDYYPVSMINLYLGAGVGAGFRKSSLDFNDSAQNRSGKMDASKKTAFVWQVGGGVGVALSKSLGLDLAIRYINFGKSHFKPVEYIKASTNIPIRGIEALLGLSYRF